VRNTKELSKPSPRKFAKENVKSLNQFKDVAGEDMWERLMLANVERHLTPTGGVKLYVRKNLIDLAERIRNHEMLVSSATLLCGAREASS